MTQETAQKIGIVNREQLTRNYLERTYMDHDYRQRTRYTMNIRLGQDANGRDIFIETNDRVPIVENSNFHFMSQSLQDQRSRIFFVVGMDTIQHNGLQIRVDKQEILMPNPNYQPPNEKKFYKFRTMQYPDLSIPGNRDFNIQNINKE
jgi:hypothetical protein